MYGIFDLVVDQFDSTNIKVVDKSDAEVDTPSYTKYQRKFIRFKKPTLRFSII